MNERTAFRWSIAATVAISWQACFAQMYDLTAVETAKSLCVARSIPGDPIDCAHAMIDRWAAIDADERKAAARQQGDAMLKACRKNEATTFDACVLSVAAGLGDKYVDPAMALAKWNKSGEVSLRIEAETAKLRAGCKKQGWGIGQPAIGMTPEQSVACGWGLPADRKRVTTAQGVLETWIYSARTAITLRNGRVSAIAE